MKIRIPNLTDVTGVAEVTILKINKLAALHTGKAISNKCDRDLKTSYTRYINKNNRVTDLNPMKSTLLPMLLVLPE